MSKNLPAKIHIPEIDADFLLIPAGAFYVGGREDEEAPRRLAAITRPFYMQETPVTQRQYQAITGTNPSEFKDNPDNPVEKLDWDEAVAFAERLSSRIRLKLRLPTEMEWEYAARGGDGDKYTYAGSNDVNEVGWYDDNANNQTQPAKQKKSNGFGLYDMSGNVWEWCSDWYNEYPNQELIDYQGSTTGQERVFRGGSWFDTASNVRVAPRGRLDPGSRVDFLGFRLVLEIP